MGELNIMDWVLNVVCSEDMYMYCTNDIYYYF